MEKSLKNSNLDLQEFLNNVLIEGQQRHGAFLAALDDLSEVDGFKVWREREHAHLSDLVQKRLFALQNPENCSTARKLYCKMEEGCGFGCELHYIVNCLVIAYGTERTLLLDSRHWSYISDQSNGFEEVFMPLSETCVLDDIDLQPHSIQKWPGEKDAEIILPQTIYWRKCSVPAWGGPCKENKFSPDFYPPAIPEDLADRIIRLHGDPRLWWWSQFLKYIWRPQKNTRLLLNVIEKDRDRSASMVGIHIRRNDKLIEHESDFHEVEEYMKYVKEYFQQIEIQYGYKSFRKQVYVASDDPSVFNECRTRFPEYEFLGDESRARSAALSSRYNLDSLQKVISDIHMLSSSDLLFVLFHQTFVD